MPNFVLDLFYLLDNGMFSDDKFQPLGPRVDKAGPLSLRGNPGPILSPNPYGTTSVGNSFQCYH